MGKLIEPRWIAEDRGYETPCWTWQADFGPNGYGREYVAPGVRRPAHVLAYERARGPVPDGLEIDHLCRNRACVNPDHMEAVTRRENTLRGESPAAKQARQTHCIHGHPFDEENTYRHPKRGSRHCRACHLRRQRERRRQLKNTQLRETK